MSASARDVVAFLQELKQIVAAGRGLDLIPRAENNQTIVALGFTKKNVDQEVLALSAIDYCEGPLPDRNRPGNVWIFGRRIDGKDIYIKLKIAQTPGGKIAKCISFHEAKYPLRYPLR